MSKIALYRKNGTTSKEDISILNGIKGLTIIEENSSSKIIVADVDDNSLDTVRLSLPEWGIESNMSFHPSWGGYK